MSSGVKAVVFDVGNVLYYWDPRYLYDSLIGDPAACDDFLARVVTHEWHFQHDAGRDFTETSAELIAQFPEHDALIRAFGPRFLDTIGAPVPGMAAIVAELDAAGVPLFAITNFSHEFWPPFHARERALFDRFRDVVVSGYEKLVKPDPAIYALALARFGLGPGEALFVDDRAENVAGADAAGLVGHLFDGADALRARLVELRLLRRVQSAHGS